MKIIGLVPLWDDEKDSIWMLPGYEEGLLTQGLVPLILPYTDHEDMLVEALSRLDGLLLTGGHDVNPSMYGERATPQCAALCDTRDRMERILFREVMRKDLPILGICRGIQMMNVLMGGTLYQDLPTEHPSQVNHRQKAPYDQPIHSVKVLQDTPLHGLLQTDECMVNSCHHQAIKVLAEKLIPMAVAEDGIIEAAYCPSKRFVWGVQWHPEFAWKTDPQAQAIFTAFAKACRAKE